MIHPAMIQKSAWAPDRTVQVRMGQQLTPLVAPAPVPAKKSFIDSAAFGALVAASGAVASGVIAYTYSKVGSKWGSFFWVLSGITGFVALDDLSRLRGR